MWTNEKREKEEREMRERIGREQQAGGGTAGKAERLFSVPEIAAKWRINERLTRSIFVNEPGTIITQGNKRPTIRIPASVADRVYKRFTTRGG